MATTRRDGARERLLIGLRIRDVRLQYGHSLERFAERLGVSPSHLSNIECGRKLPRLELLIKIADDFDCSLDYLVLGRQQKSQDGFLVLRSDDELLSGLLFFS